MLLGEKALLSEAVAPMHADIVPVEEISAALEHSWRELAQRALEPNPFFEPDLVLPASRHLEGGDRVELLVVRDGSSLRACIPLQRIARWRKLRFPGLMTWRHPYCYLGTPLVDRDCAGAAIDTLLEWLRRSSRPAKYAALEWMNDGAVLAELEAGLERARLPMVRIESFERALLRVGASPLAIDEPGETWKRLARRRRSLERDHGATRTSRDGADRASVDRFLALEASGWKAEGGTALASQNGDAQFFREMVGRFDDAGRVELRSYELVDGGTLAMACRLTAGPETFCFKVGYDESYRKYAPGLQLEVDTIEETRAAAPGSAIDSCADPSNDFFNRLFPQRRALTTLLLPGSGVLAKPLVRAVPALRAVRRQSAARAEGA
jgi:CelD/BcsL family acetyltransferase involved in cellulose biosynthesis